MFSVLSPADSDGKGRDTYGVYPHGYRGLFETLKRVGVPVERRTGPFTLKIPTTANYVLLTPDAGLMQSEMSYVHELADWVRRGGCLTVCMRDGYYPESFHQAFGLEELVFQDLDAGVAHVPGEVVPGMSPEFRDFVERYKESRKNRKSISQEMRDHFIREQVELRTLKIAPESTDPARFGSIEHLKVDDELLLALDVTNLTPNLAVTVVDSNGAKGVIACELPVEQGVLRIISEPSLFENISLYQSGNAPFLVGLLAEGRDQIIFDEFFHGLSIRGNAMWVFVQPRYRVIVGAILLLVLLWAWRQAVFLGSLRERNAPEKRTLEHYLDAVSRLMVKTRDHLPSLMETLREATVWRAAHQLRLPAERAHADDLLTHLERTRPDEYQEFSRIMAEYDSQEPNRNSTQYLKLLQRSQRCQF